VNQGVSIVSIHVAEPTKTLMIDTAVEHRVDCLARQARSARIALSGRLLRRRSGTEERVPSLLLSTAARDPVLIAWLAKLARHGQRQQSRSALPYETDVDYKSSDSSLTSTT
jgi:hypothetical protein